MWKIRLKWWLIKLNLFKNTFHLQGFVHVTKNGAPSLDCTDRIKWLDDVEVHCYYKDMDSKALTILYEKYPQYKGYINLF